MTTRVKSGHYDFTRADGVDFEIDRDVHGLWVLFQVQPTGRREYLQDFTTKRAAVAAALRVEVAS